MGNRPLYNVPFTQNGSSLYVTYINLEHRTDRKQDIEQELHRIGLPHFTRFNAIKNAHGSLGCSLSHEAALRLGIESGADHIVIFEDDFQLVVPPEELHLLLKMLTHVDYDVFLMSPLYSKFFVKKTTHPLFLRNTESSNTGGYVVNKKYAPKLLKHYQLGIDLLRIYPVSYFCMDVFSNLLKKRDRWLCYRNGTFGKQRDGFSDIENAHRTY